MKNLSQIFYLLGRMLDKPWQDMHPTAIGVLTQNLYNYFQFFAVQGLTLCEKIVIMAEEKKDWMLIVSNLSRIQGDMLKILGRMEDAKKQYEVAEKLCRKMKDSQGLANTMQSQGDLLKQLDRYDDAETKYEESVKLYREITDRQCLANTLQSWGDLQCLLGKYEEAEKQYDEADKLFREIKDNLGLANTLGSRGLMQIKRENQSSAIAYFNQALIRFKSLQISWGIALSSANLSVLLGESDENQEEAKALAVQARKYAAELTRPEREAIYSILSEGKELQPI